MHACQRIGPENGDSYPGLLDLFADAFEDEETSRPAHWQTAVSLHSLARTTHERAFSMTLFEWVSPMPRSGCHEISKPAMLSIMMMGWLPMRRWAFRSSVWVTVGALALACGDDNDASSEEEPSDSDGFDLGDVAAGGATGSAGAPATGGVTIQIFDEAPDENYVVDSSENGGWKVVGALEDADGTEGTACGNVLRVIARDFPASHPDFQNGSSGLITGILQETLGEDRKPVYVGASGDRITSEETFDQWYRNFEGENLPFIVDLWLEPVGDTFVFDSAEFFPLRDRGYAEIDCSDCPGQADGFHFTTELHTSFEYRGGEVFTFRGDDDVWVFLNGRLAMDLGGVHGAIEGEVVLDERAEELGLEIGKAYPFDLFQAERQTSQSNFRIETTLDFTNCGEILEADRVVR